MDCQLGGLPEIGKELSAGNRLKLRTYRLYRYVLRNTKRVLADPSLVVTKLGRLSGKGKAVEKTRVSDGLRVAHQPLSLKAGDRVRVKSLEEIRMTLDENERCGGLAFMSLMGDFCGGTYSVRKRIDRFFDERTRRLLKARNVVILDGVFCEPPKEGTQDYAGCQRMCFLFWSEAWLERVGPD